MTTSVKADVVAKGGPKKLEDIEGPMMEFTVSMRYCECWR